MKKVLLILMVMITGRIRAQTQPIDNFLGIKFGASKAEATNIIKALGGVEVPKFSTDNILSFNIVKFGKLELQLVTLGFVNNKLYRAFAYLKPKSNEKVIDLYDDVKAQLSRSFGPGESVKWFKPNLHEVADKYMIYLLAAESAKYSTSWKSINQEKNTNTIGLVITKALDVGMDFEDGTLAKEKEAADKARN